ncbi:serpin B3-like isoform X3 [Arvicola amphibius]|uniref:serpin B3-like isoform X3 n=1 Tax=Arvicola amphibius TaxID=1047088 RepID=UPI0018E3621D|nr:serpin B3-like isoform X3 [Arvicola amphibius]
MHLLAEATMKFTLELYRQLRETKDNIFYSPISIMTALAMLQLGAKGNTRQQIEKEFLDDIREFYQANVESLDFVHAAGESEKKINSWVESQTNGKIKDLFPNGSLSSSTVLVLVNAVYFKGQWDHKFDEKHTIEGKFWLNENTSKSVQMMKQKNEFNFNRLEDVQAKIVEIPYKGKELSMFILLPNEINGLKKLEDNLTTDKLIEWTSPQNMNMIEMYLSLPRFKVEEKYDLPAPLEHMGMVDAFISQKADFSGISGNQDLVVSKVLHKSFVEVNEEGTEAAAATGVEVSLTSTLVTEDFSCDHPFLFFIKQHKTNSILFFGRMSSP